MSHLERSPTGLMMAENQICIPTCLSSSSLLPFPWSCNLVAKLHGSSTVTHSKMSYSEPDLAKNGIATTALRVFFKYTIIRRTTRGHLIPCRLKCMNGNDIFLSSFALIMTIFNVFLPSLTPLLGLRCLHPSWQQFRVSPVSEEQTKLHDTQWSLQLSTNSFEG